MIALGRGMCGFFPWLESSAFAEPLADESIPDAASSSSKGRPRSRRQPGQPPSGASTGISARTLDRVWVHWSLPESRSHAPFFYCVKSYQRLRLDCSN